MKFKYVPHGVCAREIVIDVDETQRTVNQISFIGGCSGNTQGVAALAAGQPIDAVIDRLHGIRCGMRPTSCPDQLARALSSIRERL